MASSEALSGAELSVENSLLRIERMKLREALKEALDGWDHWSAPLGDAGSQNDRPRIAELRKLLDE